MSEMVERVAKAMAMRNRGTDLWDEIADLGDTDYIGRNDYRDMASAAIAAMREPTEAMKERIGWAYAVLVASERIPRDEDLSDEAEQLFWQVAIDEALK